MYIIGGTASKTIAENLAKILNQPLANITIKRFPDDELYIRILDKIAGEDVVIVQTTYPDQNIIELFLLQDAVREAKTKSITVVAPYFGYGRQDKKFQEGEAISARAIAKLISMNAERFITVDPHKDHVLKFFSIPAQSCSALKEIAAYVKAKHIDVVLAPDKGAAERAKNIAKIVGCRYDYLDKTRIDGETVRIQSKNLDVEKKNVAIIDDIISTGGTMAQSVKELKKQGANKIILACTHGLFVGSAKEKIISAGCTELVSTDTITSEFGNVHVAPCIADVLMKNKK